MEFLCAASCKDSYTIVPSVTLLLFGDGPNFFPKFVFIGEPTTYPIFLYVSIESTFTRINEDSPGLYIHILPRCALPPSDARCICPSLLAQYDHGLLIERIDAFPPIDAYSGRFLGSKIPTFCFICVTLPRKRHTFLVELLAPYIPTLFSKHHFPIFCLYCLDNFAPSIFIARRSFTQRLIFHRRKWQAMCSLIVKYVKFFSELHPPLCFGMM